MSDERDYSTETHRVVYHAIGAKITIRPDGDGLGLLEVDGKDDFGRMTMDPKAALLVAEAMRQLAAEMLSAEAS